LDDVICANTSLAFDLDTYRLLLKHLASPRNAGLELKLLSNRQNVEPDTQISL
jgi:hypothetical protein